ncbi:MAG TPA: hypothetical protein VGP26_17920 [Actinophytocola sp.]|nr:hypothetical protein [Actinophytocola sp.]
MRKRIAGMLAVGITALSTVVAVAGPAAAAPPWNISPGGHADGTAGTTNLTVEDPQSGEIQMTCSSSTVGVDLESGTSADNQLATIPASPGIQFNNCLLAGFIEFSVQQVGTWTLNGSSYNAGTGVLTGTLDNIVANISGPGCAATVQGSVNGDYNNGADVLTVHPDQTLTVVSVDPVDNCLDLIHAGATAAFDGAYSVSPGQEITG